MFDDIQLTFELAPGLCFSPGCRLPEALFLFPDWIHKVNKRVNLVDLVKSFQSLSMSLFSSFFSNEIAIQTGITCKNRLRYSRERASQSLPKKCQKLENI